MGTINSFQLGFCAPGSEDELSGRITVPLINVHGEIEGFAGRFPSYRKGNEILSIYNDELIEIKGDNPKRYKPVWWHDAFRKGFYLYGLKNALETISGTGDAVVVEGEFDLWLCHQHGLKNAVAILGSNLSSIQVSRLVGLGCRRLFLLFDADSAGDAGANKVIKDSSHQKSGIIDITKINLPKEYDPAEFINKYGIGSIQKTIYPIGEIYGEKRN